MHHLLLFLLASLLFIAVPGPSVLFAIGQALTVGRRDAMLAVAGNALGEVALVVAVALGLGALVAASAEAFTVLKLAGAAYVVWLGIQAIRHRGDARAALHAGGAPTRRRAQLRSGFVVGVTNPKTLVFFAAFLPQFIEPHAPAAPQLLVLGALFGVLAVLSDGTWALVAARARTWFGRKPERLDRLGAAGGGAMIALGVTLAVAD
jgi:threonine/homoserine/homoserine lactone efflux protein